MRNDILSYTGPLRPLTFDIYGRDYQRINQGPMRYQCTNYGPCDYCGSAARGDRILFIFFYFINRKAAKRNLCINRTRRQTHTNNYIGRGQILFYTSFENKSETDSNI